MLDRILKNWKTTTAGIFIFVVGLVGDALGYWDALPFVSGLVLLFFKDAPPTNLVSILIISFCISACCNMRMVERCGEKQIIIDTLKIHDTLIGFKFDTTFITKNNVRYDTLIVEKENVKVKTVIDWVYSDVSQSVVADTIIKTVEVPCVTQQVVIDEMDIKLKRWGKIGLISAIVLLVLFIIIILVLRFLT